MEIDVIVDDMGEKEVEEEEMETSLNLNISSVSDTPEEESSHGEKSGKKKFNLFVKPGKDTVVLLSSKQLSRSQTFGWLFNLT